MSGELVVMTGPAMAGLVRAVAALEERRDDCAVVGGVAVTARIGQAHRATSDVDVVVDDAAPPPVLEALLRHPDAEPDPSGAEHRVRIHGVKIELLPVEHLARDADLDGLTPLQTLFVTSHSHALKTATLVTVSSDVTDDRATARFARPGALVAMKLHAVQDRRGDANVKRAGDVLDIHELLIRRADDVFAELTAASAMLRAAVAEATQRVLVDGAARARSWLLHGDARAATITAEEIGELASQLVDVLR